MNAAIFIPARMASTRFPDKPLASIAGKPLIEWTWRAAMQTGLRTFIVTPDPEISRAAGLIGAMVIMTGEATNGTERCAAALARSQLEIDVVINWQGDAPLTPPRWALRCAELLDQDPAADVATLGYMAKAHEGLVRAYARDGRAEHFIRCHPLTFGQPVLAHVGLYAYRAAALPLYGTTRSWSEKAGDLEQCRWIDRKFRFAFAEVEPPAISLREVNYPGDIDPVAAVLSGSHAHP